MGALNSNDSHAVWLQGKRLAHYASVCNFYLLDIGKLLMVGLYNEFLAVQVVLNFVNTPHEGYTLFLYARVGSFMAKQLSACVGNRKIEITLVLQEDCAYS